MAIFQMKVSYISKNQTTSSPGKSGKNLSYISRGTNGRAALSIKYIARDGQYADRNDLIFYEEKNIPEQFIDSKDVVKNLEEQSRHNARIFKKYEMSLPREFSDEKNLEIAKEFLEKQFGNSYTYFWAMHNPKGTHPHMHVSVIERKLDDGIKRSKENFYKTYNYRNPEKGGVKVDKECEKREYFEKLCETWEQTLNRHLVLNGYDKIKPKDIKIVKEEEEKIFYSKDSIKEMSAVETKNTLLNLENRKIENEKQRKKLYQKNIEKEALNKMTDNKIYKLENKIKGLNAFKLKKDIPFEKKITVVKEIKTLESQKEKLIEECKSKSEFEKIKNDIKLERDLKIKSINKQNRKIDSSIKKIIETQSKKTMNKVKDNLRKNVEIRANEYIDEKSRKNIEEIYKNQEKSNNQNFEYGLPKEKENQNERSKKYKRKSTGAKRQGQNIKSQKISQNKEMKNLKSGIIKTARVLGVINSVKSVAKTIGKNQNFGSIININTQKRLKKLSKNRTEIMSRNVEENLQKDRDKSRGR